MMTAVSRGIVDQSVVLSIQLLLVLYDSYDDCGASGMADQLVVLSKLFLDFLVTMTFSPALLVLSDRYDDCGVSGMADQLVVLSSLFLYFLTAITFSPASVCDRYDDCGVSGVADQLVVLS